MKKRIIAGVIFYILTIVQALSQDSNQSFQENELAHEFLKKRGTHSLVIGTIEADNQTVRYYGTINNYGRKKYTPNSETLYEIGSITKIFTTLLLADLVKKDSLLLSDCVVDFLPLHKKSYSKSIKNVSLQNLATHTSGLPRITARSIGGYYIVIPTTIWYLDFPRLLYKFNYLRDPYKNYNSKKLLRDMRHVRLKSIPGKEFSYSNVGVGLLGYALSQKSKTIFDSVLFKTILEPLQMNNTWVTLPDTEIKNMATGHSKIGLRTPRWRFKEGMKSAGAVTSSANDMIRFLKANLSDENQYINELLEQCHKTYFKDDVKNREIGLGWIKSKSERTGFHEVIWHNGATGGFRSYIGFNKETRTGVIILSNSQKSVDELGLSVLRQLMDKK